MKVAQMILKVVGVGLEALANGIAWAGCGLQDVAEDMPAMAYKASMALTRSRTAFKRTLCKARRVARLAWSGASRGLLKGLTVLANVAVVLWMVGKVAWDFLGVSGRILTATGKRAWGYLGAMGTWAGKAAAFVATWAGRTVINLGTWGKDAWQFREELTRGATL